MAVATFAEILRCCQNSNPRYVLNLSICENIPISDVLFFLLASLSIILLLLRPLGSVFSSIQR